MDARGTSGRWSEHPAVWDTVAQIVTRSDPVGDVQHAVPRWLVVGARVFHTTLSFLVDEDGRRHYVAVLLPVERRDPAARQAIRQRYGLTEREAEVALLLARRRSNREIAVALSVKSFTAERHTERVLAKLGVSSRRDVERVLAPLFAGVEIEWCAAPDLPQPLGFEDVRRLSAGR